MNTAIVEHGQHRNELGLRARSRQAGALKKDILIGKMRSTTADRPLVIKDNTIIAVGKRSIGRAAARPQRTTVRIGTESYRLLFGVLL